MKFVTALLVGGSRALAVLVAVLGFSQPVFATDISLSRNWSFQINGSTVVLQADNITNNATGGRSGYLRLSLFATAWPYDGSNLWGWNMATYNLEPLDAGQGYSNFSTDPTPLYPPPRGTWYTALLVHEDINGKWVRVADAPSAAGQTLSCGAGNCSATNSATGTPTPTGSDPASSLASFSADKASYTLNAGESLTLSGSVQAGADSGTVVDIYTSVAIFSTSAFYTGMFYLGPNLTWGTAVAPIVSNFRLTDIAAPNFHHVPVSGIPAGDYNFVLAVTRAGKSPYGANPDILRYTVSRVRVASQAPVASPKTLNVTKAGTGSGTVTSDRTGLDCGSTCTAQYADGTRVVLSAAAAQGSTFTGWSGACSGTGSCVVTMDANKMVTATFSATPSTYTLTINWAGTGSGRWTWSTGPANCGTPCTLPYTAGTEVTLTATPDSGSTFTGWSGACSGTGPCVLRMDADKNVTATFGTVVSGPSTRILQVFKSNNNTGGDGTITSTPEGIICGYPGYTCGAHFGVNSQIVLTVVADAGSTFTGWSGACAGTGSCTVTMDADQSVTANFTKPPSGGEGGPTIVSGVGVRVIVYGTVGSGTVTSNPAGINCSASTAGTSCYKLFALGLPVILTATPSSGYVFSGWSFSNLGWWVRPVCPGTDPCMVLSSSGFVTARFNSGTATAPPPPPPYCNVSCSSACFAPVSRQSNSCAVCAAVYNWCEANSCGDRKNVLYWNACR